MLNRLWRWIKFGKITSRTASVDAGVVSEIEYRDRFGRVIGYWAYGSWQSDAPYQGE